MNQLAAEIFPVDYLAPLSGRPEFVGTFPVEDPNPFARTAFIEALKRQGVAVTAAAVGENPATVLPASFDYSETTRVAGFTSAPFAQITKLILKVSLNELAHPMHDHQATFGSSPVEELGDDLALAHRQNGGLAGDGALIVEIETRPRHVRGSSVVLRRVHHPHPQPV